MGILRELRRGLVQLLYPAVCHSCYTVLEDADGQFCPQCSRDLIGMRALTCPRCGAGVGPHVQIEGGCVSCRDTSFHFDGVIRLGAYEGLLRELILRMKHFNGEPLAMALARLWTESSRDTLAEIHADLIVPVPLHWSRRWRRGYNQSETLARGLARQLNVTYLGCLRRIRATRPQVQVPPSDRRRNVRAAFRCPRKIEGKSVLLVDDVITTGSTCSEAAKALKSAGATRVIVAALARSTT